MVVVAIIGLPFVLGASGCGGGSGLVSIDTPTEIRIGQQAAADLEHQYGVVNDPTQTARIRRIGDAIAVVSGRPDLPWSFKILNMSDVNALSLPGGPVYVTKGLVALNLSDNEMAGVLGHEIAHIKERHAVKAIERGMTEQLLAELVLGNSGAATQAAANLAIQLAVELPHSRDDEYQADQVGIKLAYNAGYPANGLLLFLQQLQAMSGPSNTPAWLQTHPSTPDRVARAQQTVAQVQGQRRPVPVALIEDAKPAPEQPTPVVETTETAK